MGNVVKFVKKEKPSDVLGISGIEGGHLYLRTSQLIRKCFGRKGELLDYIASHIEAGIFEDHNGKYFFYKSARALAEYFDVSPRQIQRWLSFFMNKGILEVEKFSRTYNVNYMSINKDVLSHEILRRLDIAKKITDETLSEGERIEVLKIEQELTLERIEDNNSEIADAEIRQESEVMLLSAIGEIVDPVKHVSTPKEMVDLFNVEFNTSVELSPELARNLVAAFKVKFNSSLDDVKKYFAVLHKCKVHKPLDQVIGYKFIDKWMGYSEASFGVSCKNETVKKEEAVVVEDAEIKRERSNKLEPAPCIEARSKIAEKIGEPYYRSWFHLSTFSFVNRVLTIVAPNPFTKSKQLDLYSHVLDELFGKDNWVIL